MNFQKKNKLSYPKFKCPENLKHAAIIMDGNGRWARSRGWPRYFGHIRGVCALKKVLIACSRWKLPYLSVFAFSTENWKRPGMEVSVIWNLVVKTLNRYKSLLDREQIRLHLAGNLKGLNAKQKKAFESVIEGTKTHKGLQFVVALNYGGRQEIAEGVKTIVEQVVSSKLSLDQINEDIITNSLSTSRFPPPDLIIRTGGVSRISNFYLWNAVYSEMFVSPLLWPEFNEEELLRAFQFYSGTQRRFGEV